MTFDEIVELWDTNSSTTMINAYRVHVLENPGIPQAIKDQLCGTGEADSGLIMRSWTLLQDTIGRLELVCRRGEQREDIVL